MSFKWSIKMLFFWWSIIVSKQPNFFVQACPRDSMSLFQKWLRYRGTRMGKAEVSTIPKKYLGFANMFASGKGEVISALWSVVDFAYFLKMVSLLLEWCWCLQESLLLLGALYLYLLWKKIALHHASATSFLWTQLYHAVRLWVHCLRER